MAVVTCGVGDSAVMAWVGVVCWMEEMDFLLWVCSRHTTRYLYGVEAEPGDRGLVIINTR